MTTGTQSKVLALMIFGLVGALLAPACDTLGLSGGGGCDTGSGGLGGFGLGGGGSLSYGDGGGADVGGGGSAAGGGGAGGEGGAENGDGCFGAPATQYIDCRKRGLDADACSLACIEAGTRCGPHAGHPHKSGEGLGNLTWCKNGSPTYTCTYTFASGDGCWASMGRHRRGRRRRWPPPPRKKRTGRRRRRSPASARDRRRSSSARRRRGRLPLAMGA